ncbi:MAG: hypothetical protein FJZ56_05355, partial [Chlamydiae bacterium]|nr:hypothetical protein [Chlamydiota bacterium]
MAKKFLPFFFLLTACNNPVISPWNYSPLTLTKSWSAPNKEIKKISRVYADSPTELPANDHVLALAELFNIG